MKNRERKILNILLNREETNLDYIINNLDISKRTLYYDIASINNEIKDYGNIVIENKQVILHLVDDNIIEQSNDYDGNTIKYELINKILCETFTTIENESILYNVSKNTIVNYINLIRTKLKEYNLDLKFKNKYFISGNELDIRKLYIYIQQIISNYNNKINNNIFNFNVINNLNLTDDSLYKLQGLLEFIRERTLDIEISNIGLIDIKEWELLDLSDSNEINYISQYIMSLSNTSSVETKNIDILINNMILSFENTTNINIKEKEDFARNLRAHLQSSYYRIKYDFPVYNVLLDEIKYKYDYLYKVIESIIRNDINLSLISNARSEEIGFIVSYFGGYLYYNREYKKKIIIVCPNGLVISNALKYQIQNVLPNIKISGIYGVSDIMNKQITYDFCISTVELNKPNVIMVHSILTEGDIIKLESILDNNFNRSINKLDMILEVINTYCNVNDYISLKKEIKEILDISTIREKPMLKELLTKDKINKIDNIIDYKEAIKLAAYPLIKENIIEESYISEMFSALDKYGPYIVLADKFALPHASSKIGVNGLGMSMLILKEGVDLMGKTVNIFCVLASPDNECHLRALTSISELFCDQTNIDKFINEDIESIIKLIEEAS